MRISVIIPALNEQPHIARAIESAGHAGVDEVLVVDGGSTDATPDIANNSRCRLLRSAPGRGRQMNAGAAASRGDVLLFLHADNWLAPDAADQVRRAVAEANVLGGAFLQRIDADGWRYRMLERGNAWRVERLWMPYGDQGIFMRRETFARLGGFPEVRLMEDLLLMRRFRCLSRPVLLPGPLHVCARRWQQRGVIRQTLRNWLLLTAERLGVSPDRMARFYYGND